MVAGPAIRGEDGGELTVPTRSVEQLVHIVYFVA